VRRLAFAAVADLLLRPMRRLVRLAKHGAQLAFRSLEHSSLTGAEVVARSIDVERQHRHRRTIRLALATMTSLGGPLERQRDPMRILPGKDAPVEVERVAPFRYARRPAAPRCIPVSSSRTSHSDCSRSALRPMDAISRNGWHESNPWRTQDDLFHADAHAEDRASGVRRASARSVMQAIAILDADPSGAASSHDHHTSSVLTK
jgi:hypothetical protein